MFLSLSTSNQVVMKICKTFPLALALIIGLSPTSMILTAQENQPSQEEEERQQPRGRQGGNERTRQGGNERARQGGGPGNRQQLTEEQRRQRINELIQKNVAEMAEKVALRADQQEAFLKLMINYEVQNQIGRGKIQQAMAARKMEERRKLGQTLWNMYRATDRKVKEILDEEQFNNYKAAMRQKRPQGNQNRSGGQGGGS